MSHPLGHEKHRLGAVAVVPVKVHEVILESPDHVLAQCSLFSRSSAHPRVERSRIKRALFHPRLLSSAARTTLPYNGRPVQRERLPTIVPWPSPSNAFARC